MSDVHNVTDLLQSGLKAEMLRQKAIAGNVANIETPGYRRVDVRFEELLAKALQASDSDEDNDVEISPEIFAPRQTPVKSNGNDVNLETEVGKMVENTLKQTAYVRLLNKKFQQYELAIDTSKT
jgi:flagellar basal-body rod protein FlgB